MVDGEPAIRSKWKDLCGKLWMGDISPHPKTGKRVQDVKITGIPLENARLAIRMCRVKAKRIMSKPRKQSWTERVAFCQALRRGNASA